MIEHPDGEFAIFVGHVETPERAHPFEVWVNGAEPAARPWGQVPWCGSTKRIIKENPKSETRLRTNRRKVRTQPFGNGWKASQTGQTIPET